MELHRPQRAEQKPGILLRQQLKAECWCRTGSGTKPGQATVPFS